jgi:hypothetical protein
MDLVQGKEVLQKCRLISGHSTLGERAFRKWKRTCRIPPSTPQRGDWLTPFETKKLIAFALLKRGNINVSVTYFDVLKELAKPDNQDLLNAMTIAPVNTLIQPCYGRDLPDVLRQLTGCTVNPRRLYRIAARNRREFSRAKRYSAQQINWWVEQICPAV